VANSIAEKLFLVARRPAAAGFQQAACARFRPAIRAATLSARQTAPSGSSFDRKDLDHAAQHRRRMVNKS
jgi:hypothetical protein